MGHYRSAVHCWKNWISLLATRTELQGCIIWRRLCSALYAPKSNTEAFLFPSAHNGPMRGKRAFADDVDVEAFVHAINILQFISPLKGPVAFRSIHYIGGVILCGIQIYLPRENSFEMFALCSEWLKESVQFSAVEQIGLFARTFCVLVVCVCVVGAWGESFIWLDGIIGWLDYYYYLKFVLNGKVLLN